MQNIGGIGLPTFKNIGNNKLRLGYDVDGNGNIIITPGTTITVTNVNTTNIEASDGKFDHLYEKTADHEIYVHDNFVMQDNQEVVFSNGDTVVGQDSVTTTDIYVDNISEKTTDHSIFVNDQVTMKGNINIDFPDFTPSPVGTTVRPTSITTGTLGIVNMGHYSGTGTVIVTDGTNLELYNAANSIKTSTLKSHVTHDLDIDSQNVHMNNDLTVDGVIKVNNVEAASGDNITLTATNVIVDGNVNILGTYTAINSENLVVTDRFLYLNQGDVQSGIHRDTGLVNNAYVRFVFAITNGSSLVPGVLGVSNPTLTCDEPDFFVVGDYVQISGTNSNNGVFEVLSHVGNSVTLKGIGLTAVPTVSNFCFNQLVAEVAGPTAKLSHIDASVLKTTHDGYGLPEIHRGRSANSNTMTYKKVIVEDSNAQLNSLVTNSVFTDSLYSKDGIVSPTDPITVFNPIEMQDNAISVSNINKGTNVNDWIQINGPVKINDTYGDDSAIYVTNIWGRNTGPVPTPSVNIRNGLICHGSQYNYSRVTFQGGDGGGLGIGTHDNSTLYLKNSSFRTDTGKSIYTENLSGLGTLGDATPIQIASVMKFVSDVPDHKLMVNYIESNTDVGGETTVRIYKPRLAGLTTHAFEDNDLTIASSGIVSERSSSQIRWMDDFVSIDSTNIDSTTAKMMSNGGKYDILALNSNTFGKAYWGSDTGSEGNGVAVFQLRDYATVIGLGISLPLYGKKPSSGQICYQARLKLTFSSVSDITAFSFGIISGADPNGQGCENYSRHAAIKYKNSEEASNFQTSTWPGSGPSPTREDSGIAVVSNRWYEFTFYVYSNSVQFWIDDGLTPTSIVQSVNLDNVGTNYYKPYFELAKTHASNYVTMTIDYFKALVNRV